MFSYAAPPAKDDPVKRTVAELMKQFHSLYKEGEYREAEVCAAAAHVLAPDDPATIAAIQMARKRGCPAATVEKSSGSECPCAGKAHR